MKIVHVDSVKNEIYTVLVALTKEFHLTCRHKHFSALQQQGLRQDTLYFINYEYWLLNQPLFQMLHSECPVISTAIYNAPDALPIDTLIQFGQIRGLFLKAETLPAFHPGVRRIFSGHYHLPASVFEKLLHHYQHSCSSVSWKAAPSLSRRERQILSYLKYEMSNSALAEALFISEHTVKSHIYNIYKKLKVSNRQSAIHWAQINRIE